MKMKMTWHLGRIHTRCMLIRYFYNEISSAKVY